MAKKKKSAKRTTHKRVHKKHSHKKVTKEKGPEYMVQLSDPKMIRKDVLESLRDVIIFMQGYEKFRAVQDEKVNLFTQLKTQIKELSYLINNKLPAYLPKGKLLPTNMDFSDEPDEPEPVSAPLPTTPKIITKPVAPPMQKTVKLEEVNELESQLQDIEKQLQDIQ
jgi:hypothetical protein